MGFRIVTDGERRKFWGQLWLVGTRRACRSVCLPIRGQIVTSILEKVEDYL